MGSARADAFPEVAIVVLAAGGSTRLRAPKQLARHGGRSLLRRAVETALGIAPARSVLVVIGAQAARMRAELAGLDVRIVENAGWEEGLAGSIRTGLDSAEAHAGAGAVLFTTCDQPRVSARYLGAVIATYHASGAPVVACAYADTVGVPALFDHSLFAELRALRGDAGAKGVIERHLHETVRVPCPEAAFDVDVEADLGRLDAGAGRGPR